MAKVKKMQEPKNKRSFKDKLLNLGNTFFIYTFCLWVMFAIFNFYQRLLLHDFSSQKIYYGCSLVEALILAKIIMVGKELGVGHRLRKLPLFFTVLVKTILFSLIVLVFLILERFVSGYFHEEPMTKIIQDLGAQDLNITLAKIFIMFIIFIQFFSFLEINKALGKRKLLELFFMSRKNENNERLNKLQ